MDTVKACGIVVEYNPFHNGHSYHITQAKKYSRAEVIVAVMSGNFLQRGEPAICDKWLRTNAALANGVDLVVELPLAWSVQAADYFAKGAIEILQALDCSWLCFGTDTKDHFDYADFAAFSQRNQVVINQEFQNLTAKNYSYSQKMNTVYQKLYPEFASSVDAPNHILGISYAKEVATYHTPMKLLPIPRKGAAFHSEYLRGQQLASATAIRTGFKAGEKIAPFVPEETQAALARGAVDWETLWPYLRYQITAQDTCQLANLYQMTEGLEYRLKAAIKEADSFKEFVEKLKTKRYTQTRLQRLLCYVLLNISTREIKQAWQNNYIHVLGYTDKGKKYLKQVNKHTPLPILSRIGKNDSKKYELSLRGDAVYQLANAKICEQNFGRIPIFYEKIEERSSQDGFGQV